MNQYILSVITLVVGYLLGSLSFSIIFTRLFANTDVRDHGSGNAGFTNTMRTAGKKAAILVFLCDALKVALAIMLAWALSDEVLPVYAAAFGGVLGHNFPLYYHFRGGKGIVVSITAIFMINWQIGLVVLAGFLVAFLLFGYVSLGSITGAAVLPIATAFIERGNWKLLALFLLMSALAIFMHRGNIKRLLEGTESNVRRKKNG